MTSYLIGCVLALLFVIYHLYYNHYKVKVDITGETVMSSCLCILFSWFSVIIIGTFLLIIALGWIAELKIFKFRKK